VLVAQLSLLTQAAGESSLREGLQKSHGNTDTEAAVLTVLAAAPKI